jgi:hypothetical protein
MKRALLAALLVGFLSAPALADRGDRWDGRDRGDRYDGRYDRGDRYRDHDRRRSSYSFSFGFGSTWGSDYGWTSFGYNTYRPIYRERVIVTQPAVVAPPPVVVYPAPVTVYPRTTYYYDYPCSSGTYIYTDYYYGR